LIESENVGLVGDLENERKTFHVDAESVTVIWSNAISCGGNVIESENEIATENESVADAREISLCVPLRARLFLASPQGSSYLPQQKLLISHVRRTLSDQAIFSLHQHLDSPETLQTRTLAIPLNGTLSECIRHEWRHSARKHVLDRQFLCGG